MLNIKTILVMTVSSATCLRLRAKIACFWEIVGRLCRSNASRRGRGCCWRSSNNGGSFVAGAGAVAAGGGERVGGACRVATVVSSRNHE